MRNGTFFVFMALIMLCSSFAWAAPDVSMDSQEDGIDLTTVNNAITACPTGLFRKIELPHSTLCLSGMTWSSPLNWNDAQDVCFTQHGGSRLCTHAQVFQACHSGNIALKTQLWLADRVADNQALYVNGTNCDDFDGAGSALTNYKPGGYCCLEWMK